MIKVKHVYIVLILVFSVVSCNFKKSNSFNINNQISDYAGRKEFKDVLSIMYSKTNLLNHFPPSWDNESLREEYWGSYYSPSDNYPEHENIHCVAYFIEKKKNEFLNSIIHRYHIVDSISFSSKGIMKLNVDYLSEEYFRLHWNGKIIDTSHLLIPDFDGADFNLGTKEDIIEIFEGKPRYTDITVVPDDLMVYVIDAEKGYFWKDNVDESRPKLLGSWKNGYSRGFAISKSQQMICYWFIAW